jgi:hypothetical protein
MSGARCAWPRERRGAHRTRPGRRPPAGWTGCSAAPWCHGRTGRLRSSGRSARAEVQLSSVEGAAVVSSVFSTPLTVRMRSIGALPVSSTMRLWSARGRRVAANGERCSGRPAAGARWERRPRGLSADVPSRVAARAARAHRCHQAGRGSPPSPARGTTRPCSPLRHGAVRSPREARPSQPEAGGRCAR